MDDLSHKINEEYDDESPTLSESEDYYPDYFRDDLVDRMEDDYRIVKPIRRRKTRRL